MWIFKYTPKYPHYTLEWEAIVAEYKWIQAMMGIQQNPEYHGEGDVLTHTRMVAEQMIQLPQWRHESESNREILFAASLLHDIAKPLTTLFEEGKWQSPKHTKIGERMARTLLWQGTMGPIDFETRERIVKLVRHHGLPIQFLNKEDPQKAIIQASQEINMSHLAILAAADVMGRLSNDMASLLSTIRYFQEFALENNCFHSPYRFESSHHRFMYLVGQKPLYYVPYNSTWGEVVLMCGIPASGKSYEAEKIAARRISVVLSTDEMRQQMGIDPEDAQGPVINAMEEEALKLLRAERPFVYDATNIFRDIRSSLVALFAKYGASVRIVYVEAPSWDDIFKRNFNRDRHVPVDVIHQMAGKLEMPSINEAHEVDYIVSK